LTHHQAPAGGRLSTPCRQERHLHVADAEHRRRRRHERQEKRKPVETSRPIKGRRCTCMNGAKMLRLFFAFFSRHPVIAAISNTRTI
jgi:hypothetical protein